MFREQTVSSALVNGLDAIIHMDYGMDGSNGGYDVDVYIRFDNPALNPSDDGWKAGSIYCYSSDKSADIEQRAITLALNFYPIFQQFVTHIHHKSITDQAAQDALLAATDKLRAMDTSDRWLTRELHAKEKRIEQLTSELRTAQSKLATTERLLGQCIAGKVVIQSKE